MKTLIFFTSQFPFGSGETFIENEFPLLADAFDRVFIISNNTSDAQTRSLPGGVEIIRIPYKAQARFKLQSLLHAFSAILTSEIKFIRQKLHLPVNREALSVLFGTYAKALEINNFLSRLVANHNLDLSSAWLYSYWMNDMAAGIALFKDRHQEIKAVCRAHGWDVYFERHQPPYLPLRNFILHNLDACYCISENGQHYFRNLCSSVGIEKVRLARLGTFNSEELRSEANTNKLVIISCSSIIALKRIDLIIESLAFLKGFEVEWTHFGTGPLEDDMKKLAVQKLQKSGHIKFRFAGQLSNAELLTWYAANTIDLFINLSETEGLPVSMMEAGSFGIPVIATNVGGVSEIILHGQNGFLLKADVTTSEAAQQIEAFYHIPEEEKTRIRKRAFEIWDSNFNAENNYVTFINSLLAI
jgi:glycosyltransferase involved in cell wall biosynthesis